MMDSFYDLRVKLSYIDECIFVLFLIYFILSLKYRYLFLYALTDSIIRNHFFFWCFIETHNNILNLLVSVPFVFTVASSFMLLQYLLWCKHVL